MFWVQWALFLLDSGTLPSRSYFMTHVCLVDQYMNTQRWLGVCIQVCTLKECNAPFMMRYTKQPNFSIFSKETWSKELLNVRNIANLQHHNLGICCSYKGGLSFKFFIYFLYFLWWGGDPFHHATPHNGAPSTSVLLIMYREFTLTQQLPTWRPHGCFPLPLQLGLHSRTWSGTTPVTRYRMETISNPC